MMRNAVRIEPRGSCIEWHCIGCGVKLAFIDCGMTRDRLAVRDDLVRLPDDHDGLPAYAFNADRRVPVHRDRTPIRGFRSVDDRSVYLYCPNHGRPGMGQRVIA